MALSSTMSSPTSSITAPSLPLVPRIVHPTCIIASYTDINRRKEVFVQATHGHRPSPIRRPSRGRRLDLGLGHTDHGPKSTPSNLGPFSPLKGPRKNNTSDDCLAGAAVGRRFASRADTRPLPGSPNPPAPCTQPAAGRSSLQTPLWPSGQPPAPAPSSLSRLSRSGRRLAALTLGYSLPGGAAARREAANQPSLRRPVRWRGTSAYPET
ncbi:hypothetical protein U9M48_006514 [Paspalum notatum var. saurae]|uniref:Uncharacterized protein n=1 Tax=Paspalum notatum var. saurae TaxID=547442 RepID=A0AAQ3SG90_PASNO